MNRGSVLYIHKVRTRDGPLGLASDLEIVTSQISFIGSGRYAFSRVKEGCKRESNGTVTTGTFGAEKY